MWPFRSQQFKSVSLPEPTPQLLFFIVFLQVAVWYPALKSLGDDVDALTRELHHDQRLKKQRAYQIQQLENARFLEGTDLHAQLQKEVINTHYQWALSGIADLSTWQSVLEKAQDIVPLSVSRLDWAWQKNGLWQGQLRFDVFLPPKPISYQSTLPVRKSMTPLSPLSRQDWQLVSVVKQDNQESALLQHLGERRWVTQGDWLPCIHLSVAGISANEVSLISNSGDLVVLSLHPQAPHQQGGNSG